MPISLTTRSGKGSALTHNEMDTNWTAIQSLANANEIRTQSFTIVIRDLGTAVDVGLGFAYRALTIEEVQAVVQGTTPSVTIQVRHASSRAAAGNTVLSSATAITNTTTGQNLTTFNDATVPADSYIWLETSSISGTVDELLVAVRYTEDSS